MVELAVLALGRSPAFPLIRLVEDAGVFLAFERGHGSLVLLKVFEIFQEEQPGRLLGVIKFGGAASFFAKNVVNVLERLFKHIFAVKPGKKGEGQHLT